MQDYRIEIRTGGFYQIQDVFGKDRAEKVSPGWTVLYTDSVGVKRFGFVYKIDIEQQQFYVVDHVHSPNLSHEQSVIIPFRCVEFAARGYNWLRNRTVYEYGRNAGKPRIGTLIGSFEADAVVGFLDRRSGPVYVDYVASKWQVRHEE